MRHSYIASTPPHRNFNVNSTLRALPLPSPHPENMRVVHHDPSDPYPNPPPTLTNSKLRKKWHAMALETREALWQEVEGSTTEPESDDGIVDPHELLRGINNKKHSLDAGDDARAAKKSACSNTTSSHYSCIPMRDLTHLGLALLSLAASAPPENDLGAGNYSAQITRDGPSRPLNQITTNSAARRDIDLKGLSDGHEGNHQVERRSHAIQSQLPQRGRSLKISSRRRGGSITTVSSSDKWKLLAKTKVAHLTSDEKMLKDELQNIVQRNFQELTGIRISRKKNIDQEPLPHPRRRGASPRRNQSGEELLTPNFTEDVQHAHNRLILDKTADLAVAEINASPSDLMLELYPSIPFKRSLLYELVKTTFRGYVTKYQAQNDPEKKKMEAANRKVSRHRRRREDKMAWRLTAVPKFMVNYHLNPSALLHPDWMSNEDSEPEGYDKCDDEQAQQEEMAMWRRNCLLRLGITGDDHDDIAILEVVKPEWRSDLASGILHELSRIHYMDMTTAERKTMKYKRIKKMTRTDPTPPFSAPYPFMVEGKWWNEMVKGQHADYLNTWSSHVDPPAFEGVMEFEPKDVLEDVEDDEALADEGENDLGDEEED
ncbi:hypothetical protein JB92DRAFT_3126107 [Gautieria morchelliformis]|nr:hypothetical protein JB92DRAFT_3126107 [Gautieria morchelliformis]